jgi:ribosome maturation factor RimP
MNLTQRLEQFVEDHLADPSHFLVEVGISAGKSQPKVMILLDGDKGISIDDCARMSRQVGEFLESGDLMGGAYTLEVSSPGIDHPLSMRRQYVKNIGRQVKVLTHEDKEVKGELIAATERGFTVKPEKKKKKDDTPEEVTFVYNDVKSTKVLVSFK